MKRHRFTIILSVLIWTAPQLLANQGIVREITHHQITDFGDGIPIDDPVLSDDGNRAVFSRLVAHPGPFPVYVIDASGGSMRQVDNWEHPRDRRPSFLDISADGNTVLGGNDGKIRVASASGSNGHDVIAFTSGQISAVRLSGDGSKIVFNYDPGGGLIVGREDEGAMADGVYMINSDGSGLARVIETSDIANRFGFGPSVFFGNNSANAVDLSHDGRRIVFVVQVGSPGDGSVFTLDVTTGALTHIGGLFDHVRSLGMSPDGSTVGYRVLPLDQSDREGWVADFNGDNARRVVKEDGLNTFRVGGNEGTPKTLLSENGASVTFGSQYHVFDTNGQSLFQVGTDAATSAGVFGQRAIAKATMNRHATRFLEVVKPANRQRTENLAIIDINPASLGASPRISTPTVNPLYLKPNPDGTKSLITATVSSNGGELLSLTTDFSTAAFNAFYLQGVWTNEAQAADLADSGMQDLHGDTAKDDGVYSSNTLIAHDHARLSTYTIRLRSESMDAGGFHHGTSLEFGPLFVLDAVPSGSPPTVDSINSTDANPGDVVTLTGTGFDPTPQNNVVVIGGVLPHIIGGNETEVRFHLPPVFRNDDIIITVSSGGQISDSVPFSSNTVPPRPLILDIHPAIELRWVSQIGATYQLLRAPDLNSHSFVPFGDPILGDGSEMQVFDSTRGVERWFYQLSVVE